MLGRGTKATKFFLTIYTKGTLVKKEVLAFSYHLLQSHLRAVGPFPAVHCLHQLRMVLPHGLHNFAEPKLLVHSDKLKLLAVPLQIFDCASTGQVNASAAYFKGVVSQDSAVAAR